MSCVSLATSFRNIFTQINILWVTRLSDSRWAHESVELIALKAHCFGTIVTRIVMWRQILLRFPDLKFLEHSSYDFPVMTCDQTDRQWEAETIILQRSIDNRSKNINAWYVMRVVLTSDPSLHLNWVTSNKNFGPSEPPLFIKVKKTSPVTGLGGL
jgi:hypothetical protein